MAATSPFLTARAPALLLLFCSVPPLWGQVVCETTEGPPGEEVTLRVEIDSPGPDTEYFGDVCRPTVTLRGRFSVEGVRGGQDAYIILDGSDSTHADSGVDVDGDTLLDGPGDSIQHAQHAAAIGALDPAAATGARVALFRFQNWDERLHPLTDDLASVRSVLESLSQSPGITVYSGVLELVRREVMNRGDPAGRPQHAYLLSDNRPGDSGAALQAAAAALAALGVRVHTFQLGGPPDGWALELVASTTGGTHTAHIPPGLIIDALPAAFEGWLLSVRNDETGEGGGVRADRSAGTFEADVTLVPGANPIVLSLSALEPGPHTLDCGLDLHLDTLRPEDPGNTLRVERVGPERLRADWPDAPGPREGQQWVLTAADDPLGPWFYRIAGSSSEFNWRGESLRFYDLRYRDCTMRKCSYDPYPPTTRDLDHCFSHSLSLSGPTLASNLTDLACTDRYSVHACDPGLDLSGTDREFYLETSNDVRRWICLSDPELWVVVYNPALACVAMGRGCVEAVLEDGLSTIVVDGPPGAEDTFHIDVLRP